MKKSVKTIDGTSGMIYNYCKRQNRNLEACKLKKIRFGIIGCGWMGKEFASAAGRWCHLSGEIPEEVVSLNHLKILSLGINQLEGNISILSNLSNTIEVLRLGENKLSGEMPKELGNLINLKRLELGYNQLSGSIPKEIGNLSDLTYLFLGCNKLSGNIPDEIGNLKELTYIYIGVSIPLPLKIRVYICV